MMMRNSYLLDSLRDPADGSAYSKIDNNRLHFAGGNSYPILQGVPILINEQNSLFSIVDILKNIPTTQSQVYRDRRRFKNYVRQRILPSLSSEPTYQKRYSELVTKIMGGNVLVIGAGAKADTYRKLFPKSEVVVSDVHCQFDTDMVFDAHSIPFVDDFFSLVIANQVLEHTSRPWIVATEIQRVTQLGGYVQLGVPFVFPYHGYPYDFYRFTPSSLRFMFSQCHITKFEAPEGNFSGVAIALANAMINSFANKYLRSMALVLARYLFWWLKYIDKLFPRRGFSMPKGFYVTYCLDGNKRNEKQLLYDVNELLNNHTK